MSYENDDEDNTLYMADDYPDKSCCVIIVACLVGAVMLVCIVAIFILW